VVAAARELMPAYLRNRAAARPAQLSIGLIEDPIMEAASAAVADTLRVAAGKLAGSGVRVERLKSPVPFADVGGWHKTMIEYEVAHTHPALEHNADVSAGLRDAIARGRSVDDAAYRGAYAALDLARDRFWAATAHVDALIFPAAPDVAPAGMKTGDPRFIVPFTAFGGPIVSIPVGFGVGGLPLGLMLIGAPGTDAKTADIARQVAPVIELPR
jgi:aspartyl-tRNA(Asn)/glutamyl-tRNA(Gln) amidotransferase subunit A